MCIRDSLYTCRDNLDFAIRNAHGTDTALTEKCEEARKKFKTAMADDLNTHDAVSYTHLHWYNKVPLVRGVCNMVENLMNGYKYPVSYTHLDVYKRQLLPARAKNGHSARSAPCPPPCGPKTLQSAEQLQFYSI